MTAAMAAMKVLPMEGPSLEERVRKNIPLLSRKLEPMQFFNDVSPILHEMDYMSLRRAVERDIGPLVFHKIWEAVRRRSGWEKYFIQAIRQQQDPQVLQVLGLPMEDVAMPQELGIRQQSQEPIYPPPGNHDYHIPNQRQNLSLQPAVQQQSGLWNPMHYGYASGPFGMQAHAQYQGHSYPPFPHSPNSGLDFSKSSAPFVSPSSVPVAPPQAMRDQLLAMQSIQKRDSRDVTKRDQIKNITASLQAENPGMHTAEEAGHAPQPVPVQLAPHSALLGQNPLGNAQAMTQLTGATSQAGPHPSGFDAPSAGFSVQHFSGYQGRSACSAYNIAESLADNTAYTQSLSRSDRHSDSKPLEVFEDHGDQTGGESPETDGEHLQSVPEELQPDADFSDQLPQEAGHPQPLTVIGTVTSQQTPRTMTSQQTAMMSGEAAEAAAQTRPRVNRQNTRESSSTSTSRFPAQVNITIENLICNAPAAFGTENTVKNVMKSMGEYTPSEGQIIEGMQEEVFTLPPQSVGTAADENLYPQPESQSAGREPSDQYPSHESESVGLSTVLFSDTNQLMNLKVLEEHLPLQRMDATPRSASDVNEQEAESPPSLHLSQDDPQHQTFLKAANYEESECQQTNELPRPHLEGCPPEDTHLFRHERETYSSSAYVSLASENLEEEANSYSHGQDTRTSVADHSRLVPKSKLGGDTLSGQEEGIATPINAAAPLSMKSQEDTTFNNQAAEGTDASLSSAQYRTCLKGKIDQDNSANQSFGANQKGSALDGNGVSVMTPSLQESVLDESQARASDSSHVTENLDETGAGCSGTDGRCDGSVEHGAESSNGTQSARTEKDKKEAENKNRKTRRRRGRKKMR